MAFIFHTLGIVIPTDFYIFERGRYTTNQVIIDGYYPLVNIQKTMEKFPTVHRQNEG